MIIKTFLEYIEIIEFLPLPLVQGTFIALLLAGVIFFTTRSYDMKTTGVLNDFPISKVSSICIDNNGFKECTKFQGTKKIRLTIVTQQYENDEKLINIQTTE